MLHKKPDIYSRIHPVPELTIGAGESLNDLVSRDIPFVIRGVAGDWPLVEAGKQSARKAREYLLNYHVDESFYVSIGAPETLGRIFYRDDMHLNVEMMKAKLPSIFQKFNQLENADSQPVIYLASIDLGTYFPGFSKENSLDVGNKDRLESIWIGSPTRIAAHNDFPDNMAVNVVGRRRFILFPPDQFRNLYLGPVDNTPAGRPISMVDFHDPDFELFPNFESALENGFITELEPGDAIFIPSMWWHHVEGFERFNILVNYWWRETPSFLGQPQNALNHAMMCIRDLPDNERKIWRDLFDYYVFLSDSQDFHHIPEHGRGVLGPMDAENSRKIRSFLLRALNS